MLLDQLFQELKTNGFVTNDGKAIYNPGDISKKTGLQKQPDGSWEKPENEKQSSQKQNWETIKTQTGNKYILRTNLQKYPAIHIKEPTIPGGLYYVEHTKNGKTSYISEMKVRGFRTLEEAKNAAAAFVRNYSNSTAGENGKKRQK